jgi:hypothetical protein
MGNGERIFMTTLEHDDLVFRFPSIEPDAKLSISFMRTLRIPDTDKTYNLPPSLGSFPLRHVEDYADNLPMCAVDRGGIVMPMWQAEAMWMYFDNDGPRWTDGRWREQQSGLPFAIKVGAGKINAVSGEAWASGLHRRPQDYAVSPIQPWLDGFAVEKGVIRQFVAMPLGQGYTVEEQLTHDARWGGLQISVTPLKKAVWQAIKVRHGFDEIREMRSSLEDCHSADQMGLGAGGRMHQKIYADKFALADWDWDATQRVFVTIIHAKDWKSVTGEPALHQPPTAEEYSQAGLPWFDYDLGDVTSLSGSAVLAEVKSVGELHIENTGANLPASADVLTEQPTNLASSIGGRQISSPSKW